MALFPILCVMQILSVNNANIRIKENTRLFDDGSFASVEVTVEGNVILEYCLIGREDSIYERKILLWEKARFQGTAIIASKKSQLEIFTEVIGDDVKSNLSLLVLATDMADISVHGIARVLAPYRHISTRVDQTNILLGKGTKVRWIPKLEIATDDVEGGHSCKVHRLRWEALFYLESRGLSPEHSEALLLNSEILRHLSTVDESIRHKVCLALHGQIQKINSPIW